MATPAHPAGPDAAAPRGLGRRRGALAVAALYALAVAVYLVLAHRQPFPVVNPDEFTYARLARSVAAGDGLTIFGAPVALRAALYIYAIAPAWLVSSPTTAYWIAKAIGTALLCLTVVPTWLLSRRLLAPHLALIPPVLMVAGSWMVTAGLVVTENLALPLSTSALAATVMALRTPGSRWTWIALGFAALATWARLQCAILVPTVLVALLVSALLAGEQRRERLAKERAALLILSLAVLVAGIVVLADSSVLGIYADVTDNHPGAGRYLATVGHQLIGLLAMAAFLPVVTVLAASARRDTWADPDLAPLLVVTWVAAVLFTIESAWLVAEVGTFHVERYMEYALPLLFVAMVLVLERRRARLRDVAIAGGVIAAALLLSPPIRNVVEERGAYTLGHRLDGLLGVSLPVALMLSAAIVVAIAAALLARSARSPDPARGVGSVCAVALVVLLVQSQAGWHWQIDRTSSKRAVFPHDLAWVDHAANGPVAGLIVTTSSSQYLETSFFNRRIERVYAPGGAAPDAHIVARVCTWGIKASGMLEFQPGCGPAPQRFVVDDPFGHPTFYGQTITRGSPLAGRLITTPANPRMLGVVQVPCAPASAAGDGRSPATPCLPAVSAQFWLDRPGVLVLRFRGGDTQQAVAVGQRRIAIAANADTLVRVPVPAGTGGGVRVALSWTGPSPALTGAVLVQGATRTPLL